jgi:hypothetical protein
MTDPTETEQPRTLKVITCINRRHPSRSCYLLVEDDHDAKIAHRQWHVDQENDREALRGAVKARDEAIALLRQEIAGYRRDVNGYTEEVAGFHGEVQRVETPTVPPALQINRDGYDDDELEDEPDTLAPENPWPIQRVPDALAETDEHGRPTAVATGPTYPDGDDDDDGDDDPHSVVRPASASPEWAR